MKKILKFDQIIDLEFFTSLDQDQDETELHRRDRQIFLQDRENRREPAPQTARRPLLVTWLNRRRDQLFPRDAGQPSPGMIFQSSYRLTIVIILILALLFGWLAGFSFFSYNGATPVNVFNFLLLFIVSQLTLTLLLLAGLGLRLIRPRSAPPSIYTYFFNQLLDKTSGFLSRKYGTTIAAGERQTISQVVGRLRRANSLYSLLLYWQVFTIAQLAGIGLNCGLITSTMIKLLTSDLAFGWQSTMQFSARAIHHFAALVALPWSWLFPETIGFPSLDEIEGSRIILKEGIKHLATNDLTAWWPFLLLALIVYGFLVRSSLFLTGYAMKQRTLGKLEFDTPQLLAIERRMTTPVVTTQAQDFQGTAARAPSTVFEDAADHAGLESSTQTVLIADDIHDSWPEMKLTPLLAARGLTAGAIHRFMTGYDADQLLLDTLGQQPWQKGQGILIIVEGWMPPLVDFLCYIKEIRRHLPARTIIRIGVVGRPDRTTASTINPADMAIWRAKADAMGDPFLELFSLIPERSSS